MNIANSIQGYYVNINDEDGLKSVRVRRFLLTDHDHHIAYLPEVRISGYGESAAEAIEMLRQTAWHFADNLVQMSNEMRVEALRDLGFISVGVNKELFNFQGKEKNVKEILQEFHLPTTTEVEIETVIIE